ncbi:peptidoglycan-binding protein [Sphingomonas qilianensis]|uniref:Peptidoglycan-binding protein n=1 Tax=Sphingomonas qilianensis TaxID=1736690 RepID=A0ABU9XV25_9SPHN
MVTPHDIVLRAAPDADDAYVAAFADPEALLAAAGVSTPLRVAHFMAQVLHETAGLTLSIESGRYSAKALGRMWDSGNWRRYFADRAACVAMAGQCRIDHGVALFSLVYGNRMGNGPPETRDGWTYRGRGLLQTTGRGAYRRFGERWGVPFEQEPDLVRAPAHALKPALGEWQDKKCNEAADHNDIARVTRCINGGQIGLEDRQRWFARVWRLVIGAPPAENATAWQVQAALIAAGFDSGAPDGIVGPRTRAAILAYRAARQLPPLPTITLDLRRSLGLR